MTPSGPPSPRKAVVERYLDGFRRGDHAAVLACLTDDVVWDLPGYRQLSGKAQFDTEIENDAFEGAPALDVDRLVEEGPTIVAIGVGSGQLAGGGGGHRFAFCTVFTFASGGDLVARVESYVVPLPAGE